MKDVLIRAIIRDSNSLKTLVVSGIVAFAGVSILKLSGVPMSESLTIWITSVATLIFGWVIEILGAKANVKGIEKAQEAAKLADPSVKVDGIAGPNFVAAVQDIAIQNATTTVEKPTTV